MRTILGIDPGTNIMGYGIIESEGNSVHCVALGVVDLRKVSDPYQKLKMIFDRTQGLILSYKPDELAIESQFYAKNAQSMLKLGRAQGVAIAAAVYNNLNVYEYTPRKIKMSVTGSGSSTKEQVALMVASLLHISEMPDHYDATDALAVAVCRFFNPHSDEIKQVKTKSKNNSHTAWKDFLTQNPDRIAN